MSTRVVFQKHTKTGTQSCVFLKHQGTSRFLKQQGKDSIQSIETILKEDLPLRFLLDANIFFFKK